MNEWFNKFAERASSLTGRSYAFIAAAGLIATWFLSGPLLGFSDTWQLLINTLTTLVTFLMVFLIQNTQNKADNAEQIKLDLILQLLGVEDVAIKNLENLTDEKLEKVLKEAQKNKKIK